jgi:hypothetical protein
MIKKHLPEIKYIFFSIINDKNELLISYLGRE